jgi:hypothetical protein
MKRLLIPVLILVVIAAVWLIQSNLEKKRIRGRAIPNYLGITADEISKIEIDKPDESVTLYKENEDWYIQDDQRDRLADRNALDKLLESAAEISVGKIISQNPAKQHEFSVDSLTGIAVKFYRNEEMISAIIVGKMSQRRTHTYIRKPESNDVYEAEGPLQFVFNRPRTGWLDHTVISLLSGNIRTIEINHEEDHFKLIRGDTANWFVSSVPFNDSLIADQAIIDNYLNGLINIQAFDFINASDSGLVNFEQPSLNLEITLFNGSAQKITFARINEDNSRVYVRREGYGETFVIRKSRMSNYRKTAGDFLTQNND